MAVTLISSPAELPADAPPGLVVLVGRDPASAAAEVMELLHAAPPCTPSEAAAELDARRRATPAVADGTGDGEDQRGAALEIARREAADALARVPPGARGVAPERLYSAAAAVRTAEEAAVEARALLGERPELAIDAAAVALVADEAVARAHQQRAVGLNRSSTLLLAGNALGILVIAGRLRTPAVEPMFVLVAACPLTALVHLVATVVARTREARAAAQLRTQALRSTGMATMAGLAARHARVKAWTERADALAAAEAWLAQARRRWAALAGASADPTQVGALVDAMAEAERAAAALTELEAQGETRPDPRRALVVLVEGGANHPLDDETRGLLERLDLDGAPATVVVASASSDIGSWAESRTGGRVGADVVDLRGRVLANLERLRAGAASAGGTTPPGPMAAGG
ncbi:MAG: hypothetical protein CYG61_09460 [Actinobacteria bacterium]|nr:MAG: hypothetical protein CYG61_09460 [Actinomycetota bacterium]